MIKNIFFVVILLVSLKVALYSIDYRILTDTNAVLYSAPYGKIQKYQFSEERELLPIISETNIKNKEWIFVVLPIKWPWEMKPKTYIDSNGLHITDSDKMNVNYIEGWLESKYCEDFLNTSNVGNYYRKILDNLLTEDTDEPVEYFTNKESLINYIDDVKFFDFSSNGYIGMKYRREEEFDRLQSGALYDITNNLRCAILSSYNEMDETVFAGNFIFMLNKGTFGFDQVYVADKRKKINEDSFTVYRAFNMYKCGRSIGNDKSNFFEFDSNTFDIIAHIKDKSSGKYYLEKWRFDNDKYFNKDGYLSDEDSLSNSLNTNESADLGTYTLTGDSVRVRSDAGTNSSVIATLSRGATVKLIDRKTEEVEIGGKSGHWAYVETGLKDKDGNAIKGWVFDAYLSPVNQ